MKATSESSSNLGLPMSMSDVLIRVWDQTYQSPHFRRSRFRPDGITFRITIACRQFPYSAAFTTNINWKKSRLEKFRMSYLRSTGPTFNHPTFCGAVRLFNVNVDPCVRINPFHFGNCSFQSNRFVHVKLRRKCMMREGRHNRQEQGRSSNARCELHWHIYLI